ncbi:MAG: FG-GAP repeat protein [Phycisphaerales bacterium]|nr:FG-GAP repeat protein [Phycisphaerales bacterium]
MFDHSLHRMPARFRAVVAAALVATVLAPVTFADEMLLLSPNEEANGSFGYAVSGVPDINGDGHDDFIVGAPGETVIGLSDAGRVYLVSGATGAVIRAHSSPNDATNGRFGFAVAGIRDLNGDGRGDYIVGAPGELGTGRAYVYSGLNGALLRTHTSGNPDAFGEYGAAVGGVGDLSGDGLGDYLIGANAEDAGGFENAGRVYVINGATGSVIRTQISPTPEISGLFGWSVDGVPDTNNDGRDDVVVGAPFESPGALPNGAGRAYLFSGLNGALLHSFSSADPQVDGHYGWSVAGIEDVGGNGFGDVIIGAPDETVVVPGVDTFPQAGRAYLYSGTGGFLAHTFIEPAGQIDQGGRFGTSVDGLDDVDGDGLGDVIIGAPGWPGYYAYVFAGDSEALLATLHTPDDLGANQSWGGAVAGVGDASGDGRTDFIVGGPGSDAFPAGPSQSGRVSLYRPLANDQCSAPSAYVELFDGLNEFTTIGATEGLAENGCAAFADPGPDAWFRYEATCTGTLIVHTCEGAGYDTKIAVYGTCVAQCIVGAPLACNDNTIACGAGRSWLSVPVVQGQCYRIRIGGANDASGSGIISLNCLLCDPADLNGDGVVGSADLSILLAAWGASGPSDLDGDGVTGSADLALLLAAWGEGC